MYIKNVLNHLIRRMPINDLLFVMYPDDESGTWPKLTAKLLTKAALL